MRHLAKRKHAYTLLKYFMSGSVGVTVDVSVLYLLHQIELFDAIAVCISAGSGAFVHYVISRYFVFQSYKRSFWAGLLYFISVLSVSFVLNVSLYLVLVHFMPHYYIIARIIAIGVVGLLSFLLNARFTFQTIRFRQP